MIEWPPTKKDQDLLDYLVLADDRLADLDHDLFARCDQTVQDLFIPNHIGLCRHSPSLFDSVFWNNRSSVHSKSSKAGS